MPRNGAGVASPVPGFNTVAASNTILSALHNSGINDIFTILNSAWPVSLGGTGGTTAITSWDAITAKGTDIASASTINLTTATGPRIDITGTTTITAVTLANNTTRIARATGIFILTASASLIVNKSTSVNYTTAVGDLMIFTAEGGVTSVTVIGGGVTFASVAQALAGTSTTLAVNPAGLYYPTGHLSGATIINNAGSAANKIDVAAGTARDSTDTANFALAAAITAKDITSAWAVGSTAGLLDTGSVANTTYYVYLIKRPDTGVVDVIASTSASAPTLPTNYTLYRQIGYFVRASATNDIPRNLNRPVIEYSGAAPVGACRAWVNFNGTGTVAIRESFNVSSITDNGTGDYTVNFTTAMPDANYAVTTACRSNNTSNAQVSALGIRAGGTISTTAVEVQGQNALGSTASAFDVDYACVAIFR